MSSIQQKWEILKETINIQRLKKIILWKYQGRYFRQFGPYSIYEKPLYRRKLRYVSIGERTIIKKGSRIQCDDVFFGKSYFPNLFIGDRCCIGYNFTAFVYDDILIGNDVSIASNVMITSENHGMNPEKSIPYSMQPLINAPVKIEDGCWIGQNVSIMPGVTIGQKSIIGANSVVTHDIPPFSIAISAPARVIKCWNAEIHEWVKIETNK